MCNALASEKPLTSDAEPLDRANEGVIVQGPAVLEALARRFPQLYVAPAEGVQDSHRMARGRGIVPEGANLNHFEGSPNDELREVNTSTGPVEVLFLERRRDFETFLQIMAHRSTPKPIARTVGAMTFMGLADWGKVFDAHEAYVASGGDDWGHEFARLAKEPRAFRSEFVVISEGPYSNVPADETPYAPDEWLRISREIRLHHECAHVVCRRSMPDDVLPVWDEITADVVGLLFATGGYDASLATRFLGVSERGFTGGRLEEYLNEEQMARIDEIAAELYDVCGRIEQMCGTDRESKSDWAVDPGHTSESVPVSESGQVVGPSEASDPFSFLMELKRSPLIPY